MTNIDFEKTPLVPAIVQDADTRQVLMLGYMNREALAATRETGRVTFFSRSRQRLWTKGETSGNTLTLVELFADCDTDTLLVLARPAGPTCHRGTTACFDEPERSRDFLRSLERTIDARIERGGDGSYVAGLMAQGRSRVAQKLGEEAVETVIAVTAGDPSELREEAADLLFHLLIVLRQQGLRLDDVAATLAARARPPPA